MADSDNTTTLPFVTSRLRRKRSPVDERPDGASERRGCEPADPAVVLLNKWQEAHHVAHVLCRLQQRHETRLLNTPASPAQDRVDHAMARALEIDAMDAEQRLIDAVATTPAHSLSGVMAKLEMITGCSEADEDPSAFPWPQLRSVLADLREVAARDHACRTDKP
ncbi:hypothetical protein G6N74_20745 [Mesorhizobium sp. CGMCC 1.15528]|uniref:Uncharacterized protein n=1 Tax=Mesorhizobium zhangyense TaxID=1776730 RepID=A0A7C9V9Y4_9HYPH|nr:hypothetical protein [Mesorhizobium zhangyense]NGN43503.1 hypothetical protein [Mesorhizobium zhangyense]